MAKKKQPAPKRGGKKKVAPKKAPARKKPIPQQVVEQSARKRAAGKASALPHVDVSELQHPTVEEQYLADADFGTRALPAPPPPTKRSKFWRQYQDTETGEFIGWRAAAKLTKDKVISRLRLRKPTTKKET